MREVPSPRPRRAWLRRLSGAFGIVLVLVLGSPVWFPWVLMSVARMNGVSIADYDRVGISRVRLTEVEASLGGQVLRAETLVVPQPLTWLTSLARSGTAEASTPLWVLRDWSIQPRAETNAAANPSGIDSIASVLNQANAAATHAAWLGGAVLAESGRIELAGHTFQVATLRMTHRGMAASVNDSNTLLHVEVNLASLGLVEARATLTPGDLLLDATATRTGSSWTLAGSLRQHTNRLHFQAVTRPGAWLPATASLRGDAWPLPLPQGLHGAVQIQAQADWNEGNGSFAFDVSGALSLPNSPSPLPLFATLAGQLQPEAVTISRMVGDWSFAHANLRGPVRVDIQTPHRVTAFQVDASLQPGAVLPWGISGKATVTLQSPATELSQLAKGLSFDLQGTALQVQGLGPLALRAVGELDWPLLQVERMEASLTSDATFTATATADLSRGELQNGSWSLDGRIQEPSADGAFRWPILRASGTAAGPFTNLLQTGQVQSIAEARPTTHEPLMLDARWRTRGWSLEEFNINATQGTASLRLQGNALYQATTTPSFLGTWTQLDWTTAGQPELALIQPLDFRLEFPTASKVVLRLPNAHWKGSAGELQAAGEIDWPATGRFNATLEEFDPSFLSAWSQALPLWITHARVRHLALEGSWNQGPLEAQADFDGTVPLPEVGPVRVRGSVVTGTDGIQFDDWTVTREEVVGPRFSARIPLRFHPAHGLRQGWEGTDGPLQGSLTLGGDTWLWPWLATRTGAEFTAPTAQMNLSGTLEDPHLQLEGSAAQARIQIPGREAPPLLLGGIAARVQISTNAIVLESLTLDVEGQPLTAKAAIPWKAGTTNPATAWPTRWTPDLERTEGLVDLPGASVTALAKPFENYLQPGGTLRGHIERRNAAWQGWLELTNVTTQPIPALGFLRDIDLRLVWADDTLQIERGQALLSGQPLTITGAWTSPGHPHPKASLRLSAAQLALVRSPELILRADLDLTLTLNRSNTFSPPVVGGLVTLHDSVVTMDVRDLVAVDLERPRQRPPFFSVDHPLLSDWTLDVQVRGNHFARILSPILRASASADLALKGTLGQPKLVGQASVDRGRLAFPFGQLEIQKFQVLFTEADPYRPRLEGKAEGLSFGYHLGMELGGTLAEPEIGFSSTPPMTTSEVLQMLMAGSLPRNEYSYSTTGKAQNVGTYLAGDLLTQLAGDPMEEPRLTFRSAQRVSANGSLTYSVEYRLSDRWSAVAEYDRWNQLGAGVRWRVLEK